MWQVFYHCATTAGHLVSYMAKAVLKFAIFCHKTTFKTALNTNMWQVFYHCATAGRLVSYMAKAVLTLAFIFLENP
jgi:hypothetical protein